MTEDLFGAVVDAGLRHETSWVQVQRIAQTLPVEGGCPYCGGDLEPKGLPEDRAGCCAACGRLHLEGANGDYITDPVTRVTPPAPARAPETRRSRRTASDITLSKLLEKMR